jgi:GTPase Era involved in 16S rRNA processing
MPPAVGKSTLLNPSSANDVAFGPASSMATNARTQLNLRIHSSYAERVAR